MKHIHFDVESDGFYGAYWACKDGSDCAVIAMLGDDPEDYMARSAVKWLLRLGVNILTMSPGKKDYGHHNYPLECIEKAMAWLKLHGNEKNRHCGSLNDRYPRPDGSIDIQRHFSNHCNDTQRLCVAGVHAGQKGWLQGMANRGRITLFLQGKALAIHAVLLSAP